MSAESAPTERFLWPEFSAPAARPAPAPEPPEADPVAQAQARAAALLRDVDARCARELEAARAEGLKRGMEAAAAEASSLLGILGEALKKLDGTPEQWRLELEPQVLRLSIRIAEKLVCAELAAKPERVLDVVRSGLGLLPDHVEVEALVNEADLEKWKAQGLVPTDLAGLLRGSARVASGACEIRSAVGFIDGSLNAQIAQVRRFMESGGDDAEVPDGA